MCFNRYRIRNMALGKLLRSPFLCFRHYFRVHNCNAGLSTSIKFNNDIKYPEDLFPVKTPPPPRTAEDFKNPKNWIAYGYDEDNYENDRRLNITANITCFIIIGICIPFAVIYAPDPHNENWTIREAYLELNRREKLGLPLIDKNLIDPDKIILPTDEELGATEVVI